MQVNFMPQQNLLKNKLVISLIYFISLLLCTTGFTQNIKVIDKIKIYRQQVLMDSNYKMVELRCYIPALKYDLRYATTNNFTKQVLYKQADKTFLRLPVAQALYKVQMELSKLGIGLKVFDAYRPYSVTKKMWELIKDERYVANPAKGSGHNRGLSIDVTLIYLATGKELDMGTGFDAFTDTAHHSFKNLPEAVLQNRQLLKSTMAAHGFAALETEWWHYSWPNTANYEVLNIPFKKLIRN